MPDNILPNGTRVRVTDAPSFYLGHEGTIVDHFDGRELGGRVAYTIRLDPAHGAQISFAATAELFEVIPDTIRPWESLCGLTGTAARCTCSDAQLANVGCDCPAQQNLPARCHLRHCEQFLRTNAEIYNGVCDGCLDFYREQFGIEQAGESVPVDLEPQYDDSDYERDPVELVGPEFADEISLEERFEHYAFEERNGMGYGTSF